MSCAFAAVIGKLAVFGAGGAGGLIPSLPPPPQEANTTNAALTMNIETR
jgi:hypothetical protein